MYNDAAIWWEGLPLKDKQKYKSHFDDVRRYNLTKKYSYSNMYDLNHLRLSQLSEKQIYRIWVFRDYVIV